MKKAYLQNVISIIKKNLVSYIAVTMLIFLSTHIFLVTSYLIDDIYLSYDSCFDYCNKYDVAAYIASGADDSIVDELSSIKGTEEIETSHISYGYIETKVGKIDTEVNTLSKKIALPFEVEGRLPVKKNEIALLKHWAKYYGIKIGDKIKLEDDEYLYEEEYVVTALFESSRFSKKIISAYSSSKITGNMVFAVAYVNKSALNNNYIEDNFIMMRNASLRKYSRFSDEYKSICEDYIDEVDDALDTVSDGNYSIEKWNEEWGYDLVNNYIFSTKAERRTLVSILFFVAIAILISTISRMILDQKDEIGIMKANGFTNNEISMIFYIFSLSATIIGIILANVFATFVTEKIFLFSTSTFLTLKSTKFIFNPMMAFLSFIISIIVIFFTTYMCIRNILKKEILDILNDKKSSSIKTYFYESFMIFKKLPTFTKMIINNMLKDSHRCIGIIFGIAGSVMLLSCGIIINRNISEGYHYQVKNDFLFDSLIFFNPTSSAKEEIESVLSDNGINNALIQYSVLILKNPENNPNMFELYVYNDKNDFSKLFRLNTLNNKIPNYKGIYVQESYKKNFKLDERGYVKIRDFYGDYKYHRTAGYFYDYMASSIAVADKETYEEVYDVDSYMNAYFIDTTKISKKKLLDELESIDGYLFYCDYKYLVKQIFNLSYNFINCVVGMFALTSILLSFLIVLNLMKVNIMERKSEFLILMINGFTKKEIKGYVLHDMFVMIVIGHIIGLISGSIVGAYVLDSLTSDKIAFMNKISLSALLISLIISSIICTIVTKMSVKELDEFRLS